MGPVEWLTYAASRGPELWSRTLEHLVLTGVSTVAAIALGLPLGILALRAPKLKAPLLSVIGLLQTIPSLAMLVLLLVLLGQIGVVPALVALTLYALLPIVRNTVTGLEGVAPEIAEAASGIGMTWGQELRIVRFPLAAPVIVAGVRTAAVISVGIATLSAFIGAGGLGDFINRGLALSDANLILLGAVPAGLLALLVDGSIAAAAWAVDERSHQSVRRPGGRRILRTAALAFPVALILGPAAWALVSSRESESLAICSKNFTEQLLLAEIMALLLEDGGLDIDRRFNLGGTMVCHEALTRGEIDLYAEYTGTALTTILGMAPDTGAAGSPEAVYQEVADIYQRRFDVKWLEPFGFDNSYVLLAASDRAEREGWSRASDLRGTAPGLEVGVTAEFAERPDGYPGFMQRYGVRFGRIRDMEPGLLYSALAEGALDAGFGFGTDGRIEVFDLVVLQDDLDFFPPYEAAPVVRGPVLERYPDVRRILNRLGGAIPDSTMRRLNARVDSEGAVVRDVAGSFLRARGLVR